MAKYERGIQLLHDVLFKSQFTAQRVRVKANKLINSIGEKKRNGPTLLQLMFHDLAFQNGKLVILMNYIIMKNS